ncbi:hypothetical protein A2215_00595 [Candidatus Berkelbacteria bacterium RIFOXYA2_FULL_43_10]|uniref:Transcription regulator TrmB N-terminal domain-containing protein n=1 Tax=Candidatus Berkelbacteria bacterium RIFOXYA2_FULL_43_10 TaxID=1797472 RepID=A0A1F5E6M2_9BACT|nr:MAG: hypothetical protein A2215_00595 [Candidatus Berkelbacteria bacterium RIFOXYA2_FULL_43_10]
MVNTLSYKLGLDKKETAVFNCVLKNNGFGATEISNYTRIPRTSVYHTISNLVQKGYIVEAKSPSGKTIYHIINPTALIDKARFDIREAKENEKSIKKIVGELEENIATYSGTAVTSVSRGKLGAWSLVEDVLCTKKDSFWLTATDFPFSKIVTETEYFRRITHRRKRMRETKSYIIADRSGFSEKIERQGENDFREVKILPDDLKLKSSIIVFGSNIGFISYGTEIQTTIIRNKILSDTMKLFFNLVWRSL